jgi:uncharacterized protein
VRFWDSSAIVPTLVDEPTSAKLRDLAQDEEAIIVWWGSVVECASAIGRRERTGSLDPAGAAEALETLEQQCAAWSELPPTESLRDDARRIVRVHDLRAADALQLAAARAASDDHPETLPFVTLDERLALAASREGFPVLGAS